jgi:hypothetical protein
MGAWLTLNGIAALLSNPGFTVGTGSSQLFFGDMAIANNGWHGLFHLLSGALGLATARSPSLALTFTWAIGATYLLAAVWGVADGGAVLWVIPVDAPGSALHAAEGALAVAVAFATQSLRRRELV